MAKMATKERCHGVGPNWNARRPGRGSSEFFALRIKVGACTKCWSRSMVSSEDAAMGVHVEWVDAATTKVAFVPPGEVEDPYGTENDRHALVPAGDDEVVIEGTPGELQALVERMFRLLSRAGPDTASSST